MGLSQVAALILYVTEAWGGRSFVSLYYGILASAGVLAGLAVTWYAMSLRVRALGGALVLGLVTVSALALMNYITKWSAITGAGRICCVLEFVLLAAAVALTISHVRGPAEVDSPAS